MRKNKIDPYIAEKLKNNERLNINGINFGAVIATEIYDKSIYAIIKHLAKCLFYNFTIEVAGNDKTRLFIYSLTYAGRKDYEEIKNLFLEYCPEYTFVDVNRIRSFKGIWSKCLSIVRRTIKYAADGIPTFFLTSVLVTEYEILLRLYLKKIDWDDVKMLGTFCDARCEDNIAAQIGINKCAKTFTLQHGQYRIIKSGYENADAEAYKNFVSDKLLAWGEATRNEFTKFGIEEKRVVPVGALKSFSFNKKLENSVDNGVFGIILCADIYKKTNVEMLRIANILSEKFGMHYIVRFHPRNKHSLYEQHIKKEFLEGHSSDIKNEKYVDQVTFSLVHMTGVFVEMLSVGSPIFIFEDEYLGDVFRIKDFCFTSFNDLEVLILKYRNDWNLLMNKQYDVYRYYNSDGDLRNNYRKALEDLEKS